MLLGFCLWLNILFECFVWDSCVASILERSEDREEPAQRHRRRERYKNGIRYGRSSIHPSGGIKWAPGNGHEDWLAGCFGLLNMAAEVPRKLGSKVTRPSLALL